MAMLVYRRVPPNKMGSPEVFLGKRNQQKPSPKPPGFSGPP